MNFSKNKKIKKAYLASRSGFSLVEVLVTLFILSIGLVVVVSLMTANIKATMNARSQIVASDLAQEGIELVQNMNDNGKSFSNGTYTISHGEDSLGSNNGRLYLSGSEFFSHDSSGTKTKYLRKIDISDVSTTQETVTVRVSWNNQDFPLNCNIANKCLELTSIMVKK